ncbi:MAG TPA: nucleotidyltransferase domain-containing protein [Nakamurella sp.]
MPGPLVFDREAIADLCRRHGVRRLAIFGSATTDRFDPERSDVDFLLEFREDAHASFRTYYALKVALEELLGRSVDLVMTEALRSPSFARTVEQTRQELYAA